MVAVLALAAALAAASRSSSSGSSSGSSSRSSSAPARLPARDAAVAALIASAPERAAVAYADFTSSPSSPRAVAAGTMLLSRCAEDLWVGYRVGDDAPAFPQAASTAAMVEALSAAFAAPAPAGRTGIAVAHDVAADGRFFHQGVAATADGPQGWVEDPFRVAGPFRSPALVAASMLGAPLCEQIAGLERTLTPPVRFADASAVAAAQLTARGDDELRALDGQNGVVRTVARYDRDRLAAVLDRRAARLVTEGLGVSGTRAARLIPRYGTFPDAVPDVARIEFIQIDGVLVGIQVRKLPEGVTTEVVELRADPALPDPAVPDSAKTLALYAPRRTDRAGADPAPRTESPSPTASPSPAPAPVPLADPEDPAR